MTHDTDCHAWRLMLNFRQAAQPLPMKPPRHGIFRVAALLLAMVLGIYCLWMVLAELYQPGVDRLPTDPQSAAIAAGHRNDANSAAWIGFVRGDLWAQSAYTYADLLWNNSGKGGSESTSGLDQAREQLDWTVRDAPHEAGAWLLLAGLALRYHWPSPDPAEALRMSYYTGPSELPLLPLRLRVASQLAARDAELEQLARRDLSVLIAHQQTAAVLQAYQEATPTGKEFIERAVGYIEPNLVESLRHGQ